MAKIVITSNTSWFIHNFFRSSIREFLAKGERVYIIAPKDDVSEKLVDMGCQFSTIKVNRSGASIVTELQTVIQLSRLIKQINPDFLLNFTPKMNIYGALIGYALGVKVINSVAGLGSIFSEKGLKPWLGKKLLRLTQPLANHTIFQNLDDQQVYIENNFVRKANCSRVKGIGIDLQYFKSCQSKDDGIVKFILVARMLKNKGIIEFIKAAENVDRYYQEMKEKGQRVPNYAFSLLGFVDLQNPQAITASQLQKWNDTTLVKYLGGTDDVLSVVKDYDCVVLPSYYREGMPQCLIEACAMAKPIITTDNVGCKETVEHNVTGYIVAKKDVKSLQNAFIKMIELPHQKRILFGKNGRAKAEKEFCHLIVSTHYLAVMSDII